MKQPIFWKCFDLIGQILMLSPLARFVSDVSSDDHCNTLMLTACTLGGWQAVSCVLTVLLGFPRPPRRRAYERLLLVLTVVAAIVFLGLWLLYGAEENFSGITNILVIVGLIEAYVLLILGPVMALWYAKLTFDELGHLREAQRHREEVHWKL